MPRRYALVAYVTSLVGLFVEALRLEVHPALPHSAAHLTILPPRHLQGTEAEALETLRTLCSQARPFEVVLGEVATFLPVTTTVYVRVLEGAQGMCSLHRTLATGALAFQEEWRYTPHLTIVKMETAESAQSALNIAQSLWRGYEGPRRVQVTELTFVREDEDGSWRDLGRIRLGPQR
jgi:2'-5' RNA ligase